MAASLEEGVMNKIVGGVTASLIIAAFASGCATTESLTASERRAAVDEAVLEVDQDLGAVNVACETHHHLGIQGHELHAEASQSHKAGDISTVRTHSPSRPRRPQRDTGADAACSRCTSAWLPHAPAATPFSFANTVLWIVACLVIA